MTDPSVARRVVPAGPADIQTIRDIAHRTWPSAFGAILSPVQIAYMLEWMYSEDALRKQMEQLSHAFMLLTDDGQPMGYSSHELNVGGAPVTKIHKLYVLPDAQGTGVGRRLLDTVREIAMQHGQRTLTLNVNVHNLAVRFYEHYGFVEAGREDIDIGNGFYMNDVIMELPLIQH